jgi:phosphatidylserine/phosphatidylglycerophosphate/cardiolipin synthase-like enzyme
MRRFVCLALIISLVGGCAAADLLPGDPGDRQSSSLECPGPLFGKVADAVRLAGPADTPRDLVETDFNVFEAVPLRQGPQIFAAVSDLIASARADVVVETWAWEPASQAAARVLDGIRRLGVRLSAEPRPATPVTVRLLINQTLSAAPDLAEIWQRLSAFHLDPARVQVQVAAWKASLLGANHAKVVVVDAEQVIVTGANVAVENDTPIPQWDFGYRMQGDVALALHRTFAAAWRRAEIWRCGPSGSPEDEGCWARPAEELPWVKRVVSAKRSTCDRALVVAHPARNAPWPGNDDYDNPQAQAFLAAVKGAERVIRLQTPDLNDPWMLDALAQSARWGVSVRIVLSRGFEASNESLPGRGGDNEQTVDALHEKLAGDARARANLDLRWYSLAGMAVQTSGPPNSHVKYLSVDGRLAIVGSANQDVQSWHNSREVNVVIADPVTIAAWDQSVFDPVFAAAVPARAGE